MFKDLFDELRSHLTERIRSPLLGPFMVAWLVTNWKLVSVLFFSETQIEQRILFIDQNYICINYLLYYPLIFAVVFAIAFPWINWGIQYIQEYPNLLRRKHKLKIDTDYLSASVSRAEAQAKLNRILAQDQMTQRQNEEIETLKRKLEAQQENANARIAAIAAELEAKTSELAQRSELDEHGKLEVREEIMRLRDQLEQERTLAKINNEKMKEDLKTRERMLESRLGKTADDLQSLTNSELRQLLMAYRYRLYHNPNVDPDRSKIITFEGNGRIGEGHNNYEYRWRINNGKLEIVQSDDEVHSRFYYIPESHIFVHTGDMDTKSARGQFIIPVGK